MTAFDSKSSSSRYEWDMYSPFADAMNHALEHLSEVQVDGLPEFKTPIVFVPCNRNVSSDRGLPGTAFKPDLAITTLEDARELYGLNELDAPKVSEFIGKISNGSPISSIGWRTILSAVEMKRKRDMWDWTPPGVPQSQGMHDPDRLLDDELDTPQPTTRKIDAFPCEHPMTWNGQRLRRRPWHPPNGPRVPRRWTAGPGPRGKRNDGYRRTLPGKPRNLLPPKSGHTRRRSSLILFRSAMCSTCSSRVRIHVFARQLEKLT